MAWSVLFALIVWTTIQHSIAQPGVCYVLSSQYRQITSYVAINHVVYYDCSYEIRGPFGWIDWILFRWEKTCSADQYSSEARYSTELFHVTQFACCNGYFQVAGTQTCTDINECSSNGGKGPCAHICTNTVGSFTCSCNTGYTLHGYNCIDINECSLNGGKGPCAHICTNTVGSFTCRCNTGYALSGYACNDNNECASNRGKGPCTHICTNTAGSFTCGCNIGYGLSGYTCNAVTVLSNNGCGNNGQGPCAHNCTLTENPNHVLCSCRPGFILLEDGRSCLGQPHSVLWKHTGTSIAAVWDPPIIEGSNSSLSYSLLCSKSSLKISLNTGNNQSGNITALEPFTNYSCCILAYTSIDSWSQACGTIQTSPSVPSTAPTNVAITIRSSSSVIISWLPPSKPNGMIKGYYVYMNASSYVLIARENRYILRELSYGQPISVQVSSYTSVGEGPKSQIVVGRTGCPAGKFYRISDGQCGIECGCGEGQVRNYKDPRTGATYDACVAIHGDNIGIKSFSLFHLTSTKLTIGAKLATVTITQPSSSPQVLFMRLSSRADTNYNSYPVVFGTTPNATDPSRVIPVTSGAWNSYQWKDITNYKTSFRCSAQKTGIEYSHYIVDIYMTSTMYPEGDWILSLNFQPPYDSITSQITVKGPTCLPSEDFDVSSKRCVAICGCGLLATEQARICVSSDSMYDADTTNWLKFQNSIPTTKLQPYYTPDLNGFWFWFRDYFVHPNNHVSRSLFSFVHRFLNFTVQSDSSSTTRITSQIYLLDKHIFLWGIKNIIMHADSRYQRKTTSTAIPPLLLLRFDIKHLYSNYSTPLMFRENKPYLVLTFHDGTKISSSDSIHFQEFTTICTRSDGVQYQSIPFSVSVEFVEAITPMSTHVFSINATAISAIGVYEEFMESFLDNMIVSISVGPSITKSLPNEKPCSTEQNGNECCAQNCTNTDESFLCSSNTGYALSGYTCNDIDECSSNGDRGPCAQICTNTPGSYTCSCYTGYTLFEYDCIDVNECSFNGGKGPCAHICTNTVGSFTCSCYTGYALSGYACYAITWNGIAISNNSLVTLSVILQRVNVPSDQLYPLGCHNVSGGRWYNPKGALYPAAWPITTPGGYGQRNGSTGVELYRGTPSVFPHGVQCCTNTTITLCVGMYTDFTLAASVGLATANPSSYALSAAANYGPNITGGVQYQLLTPTNVDPPVFQLTCTSTSSPPTEVQWALNGSPLYGSNYSFTQTVTDGPTSTYNNTLTVTGRVHGMFTCNVTTTCSPVCGTIGFTLNPRSTTASLTVQAPPNAPTNVTAKRSGPTSVDVFWTAPTSGGPVTRYDIYYVATGGPSTIGGSTIATSFALTNLQAGVHYKISVTAVGNYMPSNRAFAHDV